MQMAELLLLEVYPFTSCCTENQIRGGIEDSSKIIFLISQ